MPVWLIQCTWYFQDKMHFVPTNHSYMAHGWVWVGTKNVSYEQILQGFQSNFSGGWMVILFAAQQLHLNQIWWSSFLKWSWIRFFLRALPKNLVFTNSSMSKQTFKTPSEGFHGGMFHYFQKIPIFRKLACQQGKAFPFPLNTASLHAKNFLKICMEEHSSPIVSYADLFRHSFTSP